jgi:TRAP-type C4-dicarboxylate transport system permease small subunit
MTPSQKLSRFFDLLLNAGGVLAAGLMILLMVVVCLKVFARYALGYGLVGVDQISGTMILFMTFLGAGWVLKNDKHITIDILYSILGRATRRWADIVISALCAAVCLVITVVGTLEVFESWQRGIMIAAEIEMSRAINLIVIPIGFLLLFIQFLRRAYFNLWCAAPASGE